MKTRSKSKATNSEKPKRSRALKVPTPPTSSPKSEIETSPQPQASLNVNKKNEVFIIPAKHSSPPKRNQRSTKKASKTANSGSKSDHSSSAGIIDSADEHFTSETQKTPESPKTPSNSDTNSDNPFFVADQVIDKSLPAEQKRSVLKKKDPYITPPSQTRDKTLQCPAAPVKQNPGNFRVGRGVVHRHSASIRGVRLFSETDEKLAKAVRPDSRKVDSLLSLFSDRETSSDSESEHLAGPALISSSAFSSFWQSSSRAAANTQLSNGSVLLRAASSSRRVSELLNDDFARKERLKSLRSYGKEKSQRRPLAPLDIGV